VWCVADPDVVGFADRVLPHLLRDPVANNVAYTIIAERTEGVRAPEPGALWLRVLDAPHANAPDANPPDANAPDALVGVALCTPPRPLLLTAMDVTALDALARFLAGTHPQLPGVNGPIAMSRHFARRWSALTGVNATAAQRQGLFRLDRVVSPTGVPGRLREATAHDRHLLITWADAFAEEAIPQEPRTDVIGPVDARLARAGLIWLWEVAGAPVSGLWLNIAAAGVVRISAVYTPPELRRHGYASAAVAAASQHALDAGATACTLNTDLANPTSNKIYQAIGYRLVGETQIWHFTDGTERDRWLGTTARNASDAPR
jgi:predicted GNAT family acetyltransferase